VHKFVLCADDFALSEAISAGIIELIDQGRLGAVSCLVTSVYWRTHVAELRQRIDWTSVCTLICWRTRCCIPDPTIARRWVTIQPFRR